MAESDTKRTRFVASGGWLKVTRLVKPMTFTLWLVCFGWFSIWTIAYASYPGSLEDSWKMVSAVQLALAAVAIALKRYEKALTVTILKENPNKKPHCLY